MLNEFQGLLSKTRSIFASEPSLKVMAAKPEIKPVTAKEARLALEVATELPRAGALQNKGQIDGSTLLVRSLGLPSHHDRQKDWDSLKVLYYVLANTTPDSPVLDAGSGSKGVILNWLHNLGYNNLFACDRAGVKGDFYSSRKIDFTVQDLAKLNYESGKFAAISCVSVIEHGVDLDRFFSEMSRLLISGGHLLISTDYWPEPVDCNGIYPYGEQHGQMKVFDRKGAEEIVVTAAKHGLDLVGPARYDAKEKSVRWDRVDRDYTFLFLPLKRRK